MQLGLYIDLEHAPILPHRQFDFIEANLQSLLIPDQDETAFNEQCELVRSLEKPVSSANRFLPPDLAIVGPEADGARLLGWANTAFCRAEVLGIRLIVWGSGATRTVPEGFPMEEAREQFLRAVSQLAPLAERHGITLAIKPVSRLNSNFITSLADGAAIVHGVGHPRVRLLANVFHMMVEEEPASEIERFAEILVHVQLAELKNRAAPGTHGDDFRPHFTALKNSGYDKAIVVEPKWTDATKEPALALQTLKAQMVDVGLQWQPGGFSAPPPQLA
ncbi:MAG: sugar phosphate isomerase/epimerase [Verrucomicrobiota bacterium]|nr:sugar phosphate isomerase/epimerase [Verrucomicrobiota bacterium]